MQSIRETVRTIKEKFEFLQPLLDERLRRLWAGSEARALGVGGITVVCRATKLSRTTVRNGIRELEGGVPEEELDRVRRPGAGRPRLEKASPELLVHLEQLVEPLTRGDPESPLRWTSKSGRKLATELKALGFSISPQKVHMLLKDLGYSLQANQKTREGVDHPDRDAQFEYINRQVTAFLKEGQPVISVDTKKKELIGDFKNGGREWNPKGCPDEVRVHDFIDKELGKVVPYGVYDVAANQGWVSVGTDHDTPKFAVESIRRWWKHMGKKAYPDATRLLITADAGGSNSYRARAWKYHLHRLALDIGVEVTVCHFPPGTSKWNKIEHRMFSHISMNWRGRPLISHEVVINLIANTTTSQGLKIKAQLDNGTYAKGEQISDEVLAAIPLTQARVRGAWNYRILPVESR